MDSAGSSQPPSSVPWHGSSAAHQPSAPASIHAAAEPPAADWASLPPELLRLCFLKCAKLVQGGQCLPLQQAAQLLSSMSPCRAWRAVAVAEASAAAGFPSWAVHVLMSYSTRITLSSCACCRLSYLRFVECMPGDAGQSMWSSVWAQCATAPAPSLPTQLLQVPFQLQLEDADALQHPLLRTLRIARLSLPRTAAAVWDDEEGLEGQASFAAWQQRKHQLAADITAHFSALLADGSVHSRLSSSLKLLSGLPAAAALEHPQLLSGFRQLVGVQLCGGGGLVEVADIVVPSFFPASVSIISMSRYGMLCRLPWLPARPLLRVAADGVAADVRGPQPQRTIKHLSLVAAQRLRASLQALSCFNCQRLELASLYGASEGVDSAGMGTLELQPSAANVDQWMHRALGMQATLCPQPSSPLQERLAPWGLALHPLFSAHAGLQAVRLVGASLQLAFLAEEVGVDQAGLPVGAWLYWPPAQLAPSAEAPGSEAADLTVAGLSLSLRLGSRPGTLELTAQRSAAGLEELTPL